MIVSQDQEILIFYLADLVGDKPKPWRVKRYPQLDKELR